MITARRNAGFERLFASYLRGLVRSSFETLWLREGAAFPPGGFIAIANHTSWWDGFIPCLVQRTLAPQTPFSIMMSERELRRFPFFRLGGAFSIEPAAPRDAHASLRYAATLAESGSGVWIFPQGRLTASSDACVFQAGFVRAARWAMVPIVPIGLRFVMRRAQRPEAFVDIGHPLDAGAPDVRGASARAVELLLARIDGTLAAETPAAYQPFLRGRSGIDARVARLATLVRAQ